MNNQNQMAVSAMSELPQTKQELKDYFDLIKQSFLSGENDIIDIAKKVNMMGRIVDLFEKDSDIQALLINEADKYGKGERTDIQIRETGVKYYYLDCGHAEYNRLLTEKKIIEERLKSIETVLKVQDGFDIDKVTGEEFEYTKAAKSSSTKAIILLNK
jgi:hypothetical protein